MECTIPGPRDVQFNQRALKWNAPSIDPELLHLTHVLYNGMHHPMRIALEAQCVGDVRNEGSDAQ
jgi:hypothetical protein